jgi:hypothetical protein
LRILNIKKNKMDTPQEKIEKYKSKIAEYEDKIAELKKEILERLERLHKDNRDILFNANSKNEFFDLFKSNFIIFCRYKIIDADLIKKYEYIFNSEKIYLNIDISDGFLFASDNSKVNTHGNSVVFASENSVVISYDNSEVFAYDNSKVFASGNSKVIARKNLEVNYLK